MSRPTPSRPTPSRPTLSRPTLSRPTLRAALAFGLLSAWLVLLLAGAAFGGAVYLLLPAALLAFPWRALGAGTPPR